MLRPGLKTSTQCSPTDVLTRRGAAGDNGDYGYDGDGKWASMTTGGSMTSYVYDAARSLPVVLTDGTLKYVWGVGLAYTVDGSGNVQVAHSDGLGSVRALTNGTGTVVQTYQTDPFGVATQTQGSSTQPFQFTGEQKDSTGLYYLRARMYDPSQDTVQRSILQGSRQGAMTAC